jgi:hypothetical protein
MGNLEVFLAAVLPRLTEADTAFHNGNPSPRIAMWSHNDPVTLFGAAQSGNGWAVVGPTLESVASRFSNCESFDYKVTAAGVSGDLAYIAGIEHTTASVAGQAPQAYSLSGLGPARPLRFGFAFRQNYRTPMVASSYDSPGPGEPCAFASGTGSD